MSCASVQQMKRDGGGQRALFAQQLALAPLMYIWDPTSPPSLPNGTEKLVSDSRGGSCCILYYLVCHVLLTYKRKGTAQAASKKG